MGGADLDDSLATLVAYSSPDGPREVLFATVAPEAEGKLLEAVALSEQKLVAVQVEKEVTGRLPVDEKEQLFERVTKAAKEVNGALKAGNAVPETTQAALAGLAERVEELRLGAPPGSAERAMAEHYAAKVAELAERAQPGYAVPYASGGKVGYVAAYETTATQAVTEHVPASAEDAPPGLLAAQVRPASRIKAIMGADGTASWDGKAREPVSSGKEYAIDLGDGYAAVYRPSAGAAPTDATVATLRGSLEVVAPPGAGHGHQLVERLGRLNLVNRPMTQAEGEWAYLQRNVWAQKLDSQPQVSKALAEAHGLEDAVEHVLFAERACRAIGMNEAELHDFARQLRLDAEAKALPEKVKLLREAVAKATGHESGDALAQSPGYDPAPRASGGWLTWGRFDVEADAAAVDAAFGSRGLGHRVTGDNLVEVVRCGGVLASTERRRLMGIASGKGMSESSDMASGGARSVFLRAMHEPAAAGPYLYWEEPSVLLERSDWYAYPSDHFGATEGSSGGWSTSGQTRDPKAVAAFTSGSNEVMFRHGLDLLGRDAPSLIRTTSSAQRAEVLALLQERGVTSLRGRPVAEVVR